MHALKTAGLLICFAIGLTDAYATHNLAGQVSCRHLEGLSYEITLTTYTDPAPAGVDRCSANLEIWDLNNPSELVAYLRDVARVNGDADPSPPPDCNVFDPVPNQGETFYGTIKRNIYRDTFDFPDPGVYQIRYFDIARREDVINMNDPGSMAFYIFTELTVFNSNEGVNHSPILLNHPIEEACVDKVWTHNPGAFDPDGDSLAFALRPSYQYDPLGGVSVSPVNNYRFPDNPAFGVSKMIMDPLTGLVTWESPPTAGVFNLAYEIFEYRNGQLLGSVVRDMAIMVRVCPDIRPPILEAPRIERVRVDGSSALYFTAYDPDPLDSLYLGLNTDNLFNNGPFSLPNAPEIRGEIIRPGKDPIPFSDLPVNTWNGEGAPDTIRGVIMWTPTCEDMNRRFSQIDLHAHDNFGYMAGTNKSMLSDHSATRLEIVPPAPKDFTIKRSDAQIELSWSPPECSGVLGYHIYFRENPSDWQQDSIRCDGAPTSGGFDWIGFQPASENPSFLTLPQGLNGTTICYRVVAEYPVGTSCATEELCLEDFTTSLGDRLSFFDWDLIPNPATDEIRIGWRVIYSSSVQIQLIDLAGRTWQESVIAGRRSVSINVSGLPVGIYAVKIQGEMGMGFKRLVKR